MSLSSLGPYRLMNHQAAQVAAQAPVQAASNPWAGQALPTFLAPAPVDSPAWPVAPLPIAWPLAPLPMPAAPLPLPPAQPVAPALGAPGPVAASWTMPAWGGQVGTALQQVSQQAWSYLQSLLNPAPAPAPSPTPSPNPSPNPGPAQPPAGQVKGKTSFVVSSFNILGSGHTAPGGTKAKMASGLERMDGVLSILKQNRVEVVGFQEMQKDQAEAFVRRAGSEYGLYPGVQKGKLPTHNSMAWRKDTFDMVKATTMEVPYFFGKPAKMPVVRLRHKQTGQEFYLINVHNPASTSRVGDHEKHRDRAEDLERDMVKRLQSQTGLPVFLVGDLNEREDAYQSMVKEGGMRSSDQGPKGQAPKRMNIDWIFGTREVAFSQHQKLDGGLVDRTTDHPVIISRATIGG